MDEHAPALHPLRSASSSVESCQDVGKQGVDDLVPGAHPGLLEDERGEPVAVQLHGVDAEVHQHADLVVGEHHVGVRPQLHHRTGHRSDRVHHLAGGGDGVHLVHHAGDAAPEQGLCDDGELRPRRRVLVPPDAVEERPVRLGVHVGVEVPVQLRGPQNHHVQHVHRRAAVPGVGVPVCGDFDVVRVFGDGLHGLEVEGLDVHEFLDIAFLEQVDEVARDAAKAETSLDLPLFLRIAPELYLKRLLVGGFEKVFELNRNFRNEGIDTRHNPEFTMCEFYWAYATFEDLMDFTEQLFAHLAMTACGTTVVPYQGEMIDLTPGKWTRLSFYDSLTQVGGHAPEFYNDYGKVKAYIRSRGEKAADSESLQKLHAKLFDLDVEGKLIQPHFIYHYTTEISPLSRRNDEHPELTDRFELFITGRELSNAFSELNDPVDQRLRFEDQVREREAGDDEAHSMDQDYLRALEYGMPPAAGQGVGIDRLVMLLTDCASIREVILFPLLRPEVYNDRVPLYLTVCKKY